MVSPRTVDSSDSKSGFRQFAGWRGKHWLGLLLLGKGLGFILMFALLDSCEEHIARRLAISYGSASSQRSNFFKI